MIAIILVGLFVYVVLRCYRIHLDNKTERTLKEIKEKLLIAESIIRDQMEKQANQAEYYEKSEMKRWKSKQPEWCHEYCYSLARQFYLDNETWKDDFKYACSDYCKDKTCTLEHIDYEGDRSAEDYR